MRGSGKRSSSRLCGKLVAVALSLLMLVPVCSSISSAFPSTNNQDYAFAGSIRVTTTADNRKSYSGGYKRVYINGKGARPAFFPNPNEEFYPNINQTPLANGIDLDYLSRLKGKKYYWWSEKGGGLFGQQPKRWSKTPDPVLLPMLLWYGYGGPGSNYSLSNAPGSDAEVRDYLGIEENLYRMLQGEVDERDNIRLKSSTTQWQRIENLPRPDIGIYPDPASWLAFSWASGKQSPEVGKVPGGNGSLVQSTEAIQLTGSQASNSVRIPMQAPFKLVRSDGREFQQGEQAEIGIGQSFRIEAPLGFSGSYQALDLPATRPVRFYPIILQFGPSSSADCVPRLVTWDVDYGYVDLRGIVFAGEGLPEGDLEAELQKVDTDCFAITGAKFLLGYRDNSGDEHFYVGKDQGGHAVWGERGQAVVLTTDASGKIRVGGLPKHLFFFEEIEAAGGYKLPGSREERLWWFATDEGNAARVWAENEALPDVRFRKVSSRDPDKPLPGAEFAIYGCSRPDLHTGTGSHILTADPNNPLNCWVPIQTATSDNNGNFSFRRLPSGEYRLVETKAPAGFRLPTGQWQLIVDAEQGVASANALDPGSMWQTSYDCAIIVILNDEELELPATGGWAKFASVCGAVLIAGAGLLFFRRRGRMRRQQGRRPREMH